MSVFRISSYFHELLCTQNSQQSSSPSIFFLYTFPHSFHSFPLLGSNFSSYLLPIFHQLHPYHLHPIVLHRILSSPFAPFPLLFSSSLAYSPLFILKILSCCLRLFCIIFPLLFLIHSFCRVHFMPPYSFFIEP
jgi:hypothetical protein